MGRISWLRVGEPSQRFDKGTNQAQIRKNSGRQEKNIVTIFVKFRWKLNWRFPLRSGKTDITEPVSYHT